MEKSDCMEFFHVFALFFILSYCHTVTGGIFKNVIFGGVNGGLGKIRSLRAFGSYLFPSQWGGLRKSRSSVKAFFIIS